MKVGRLLIVCVIILFITQLFLLSRIASGLQQEKTNEEIRNNTTTTNYNKICSDYNTPTSRTTNFDDKSLIQPYSLDGVVNYTKNFTWTVVIGIPTTANKRESRMRIRATYMTYYKQTYCLYCESPHSEPQVLVLFFIGRQSSQKRSSIVLEQQVYGDLVELDVPENMNQGKTYHVFEWIYNHLDTKYVMKADDDSFIVIENLVKKLHFFQSTIKYPGNIYYGFPCYLQPDKKIEDDFMCGMGYVLGRDLLKWVATNEYPRGAKAISNEDITTGLWMTRFPDAIRIGNRIQFHEPPTHKPSRVAFEYNCEDILVHPLKTLSVWTQASLYYFNCCTNLKAAVPFPFCVHQPLSETTCSKGRGVICYPETVEPLGQFKDTDNYFDDARYAKHALYSQYFGKQ